jgi:hypothetical protein
MWLFFTIPLLFIIFGSVTWWAASPTKPKVSEFGRMMVGAGLFCLCLSLGAHYFPRR